MTTTTTLTKTQGTSVFAAATVASALYTNSAAVDVSSKVGPATLFVSVGRTVNTGLTNEVGFRIDASAKSSGNDQWFTYHAWQSVGLKTASGMNSTTSGSQSPGATIVLASGTGANAGDLIFFNESGAYEWGRVESVSSATLTMEDNTTQTHATGISVYDGNERYAIPIDVSGLGRIRLTIDTACAGGTAAAASGQTVVVEAFIVTADSASTA